MYFDKVSLVFKAFTGIEVLFNSRVLQHLEKGAPQLKEYKRLKLTLLPLVHNGSYFMLSLSTW